MVEKDIKHWTLGRVLSALMETGSLLHAEYDGMAVALVPNSKPQYTNEKFAV